nr:unnamed protein product [Callosobruchus chinensis]
MERKQRLLLEIESSLTGHHSNRIWLIPRSIDDNLSRGGGIDAAVDSLKETSRSPLKPAVPCASTLDIFKASGKQPSRKQSTAIPLKSSLVALLFLGIPQSKGYTFLIYSNGYPTIMKRWGARYPGSPEYGNPSGVSISKANDIQNNPAKQLNTLSAPLTRSTKGTTKLYSIENRKLTYKKNVEDKYIFQDIPSFACNRTVAMQTSKVGITYKKKAHNGLAYQLIVRPKAVRRPAMIRVANTDSSQDTSAVRVQPISFRSILTASTSFSKLPAVLGPIFVRLLNIMYALSAIKLSGCLTSSAIFRPAGSAGRQLKLRNTSSSIVLPCAEEEARIWKLFRRREDRMPRRRALWTEADLRSALLAISNGTSIKSSAKQYGIPRTTLGLHYRKQNFKRELGRSSVLSSEQENDLMPSSKEEWKRVAEGFNSR